MCLFIAACSSLIRLVPGRVTVLILEGAEDDHHLYSPIHPFTLTAIDRLCAGFYT